MEAVLFTLFSSVAIGAALLMILQRQMVYAVGLMIVVLISIGGLFLVLNAEFLFFVQLIVYAGAVMVFFVFTAMMIGEQDIEVFDVFAPQFWIALVIVSLLLFQMGILVGGVARPVGVPGQYEEQVRGGDPIQYLGERLFRDHVVALEGLGVLILVALVGAIYVSRDPGRMFKDDSTGSSRESAEKGASG
jgi:NADH-quinone oxidoreductase subunit J